MNIPTHISLSGPFQNLVVLGSSFSSNFNRAILSENSEEPDTTLHYALFANVP